MQMVQICHYKYTGGTSGYDISKRVQTMNSMPWKIGIFRQKPYSLINYANYANYLIKYARYRLALELIEFYGENFPKNQPKIFDIPSQVL